MIPFLKAMKGEKHPRGQILFYTFPISPPVASSRLFLRLQRGVAEPSLSTVPIGSVAGLESDKCSAGASVV